MALNSYDTLYATVKETVVSAMKEKGGGLVEVPLEQFHTYFSADWTARIVHQLRRELAEEFGITKVHSRSADPQHEVKACIIIE